MKNHQLSEFAVVTGRGLAERDGLQTNRPCDRGFVDATRMRRWWPPPSARGASLLVGFLTACLATGCGDSTVSREEGSMELKLAYVMAPVGAAHEASQRFAALVEEKTAGEVTVKLYPSAQLGNDRELSEGLMIGSVDLVLGGMATIGWYLPQYAALEAPFTFRSYEHLDHVLDGDVGHEVVDALLKARGIRILDFWHRGPRYLTTTNKPINTPEDLVGLKLRVPELPTYIAAWKILGTNPTPITYSEMFMALKQGIVEGQENPLEVIYSSSLYEVQEYAMKTEHLLSAYMLMVKEGLFQRLSAERRAAIETAAAEAGDYEHELMTKYDHDYMEKLKERGMTFVEVDKEAFREPILRQLPKQFLDSWEPGFYQRIIETP